MDSLLEIYVKIEGFYEISGKVVMIPFSGTAKSDFFNGTILPGGVDVQKADEKGIWTLCARYMIDGTDKNGKSTRIFIQNVGQNTNGQMKTVPQIFTDNEELKWLETAKLTGSISDIEGGVKISFVEDVN